MTLTTDQWAEAKRILQLAMELEAAQRDAFVERECAGDAAVRAEVESLLRAREGARDFLQQPLVDLKGVDVASPVETARVGQMIGPYRIEAVIGRGGMGEVFRAVRADGEFERRVAIKLVRSHVSSNVLLNHFRREQQILASLENPHIAQLYDAGVTTEVVPYLVIEYVDGVPIDQHCANKKLDLRSRLTLFLDVCDAVQFAHQRLIVHRDLKPANILVTAAGQVKLLDFGIAKVLGDSIPAELTQGQLLTPAYASPEQIRGEAVTTASDVYSLGVLLFELLAGRSPYASAATNAHALAVEICETEPPAIATVASDSADTKALAVPRDLESIVRQALRKPPRERYASVEQLASDIRRFLNGEPVQAARGSSLYRVRKFVARNRYGVAAAAIAIALGSAGILEIVRQRQIAERRFNDVRELANTVVFDVHDAIAELPGSTPARKAIVERALQYLDRLEREGAANVDLQRDMATAYEKVANIQGAPNSPNLGEIEMAEQSYRKALALRQALVTIRANSAVDDTALARVLMRFSNFQRAARGNVEESLRLARESVAVIAKAVARAPGDTNARTQLFDSQLQLADVLGGGNVGITVGQTAEAAQVLREAQDNLSIVIRAFPEDHKLKHKFVNVNAQLAEIARQSGDRRSALDSLSRVRIVLVDLQGSAPSPRVQGNLAAIDARRGEVYLQDGNAKSALEAFRSQHEILVALRASDPKNANYRYSEIGSRANMGLARVMLGDTGAAISLLSTAAEEFEQLAATTESQHYLETAAFYRIWLAHALKKEGAFAAALRQLTRSSAVYDASVIKDAANMDAAVSQAMILAQLGTLNAQMGDRSTAERLLRSSVARAESLAARNPTYADISYALAEASAALGDLLRSSSAPSDARPWYQKSLTTWRSISNPGPIAANTLPLSSVIDIEAKLQALGEH